MAQDPIYDKLILSVSQANKEQTIAEFLATLARGAGGVHEVTATTGTEVLTPEEAECGLIRATGTLVANLTIQLPAEHVAGQRIISNETAGAFSLFVEFDGGSAAEEITQGEAALFIDGATIQMGGGGGAADGGVLEFEIQKEARAGIPPTSNPATQDTRNIRPVADFDAGTDESLIFILKIPDSYSGGNILVYIDFAMTSATSGNVVWQAAWENGNTDIDADSFAAAQSSGQVAVNGSSGIKSRGTITFTSAQIDGAAAGDLVWVKINRDADSTSATDDAAGDAELELVTFVFPVDQ
jgi:hypothetical protein